MTAEPRAARSTAAAPAFSDDQAAAWARITGVLAASGVDLAGGHAEPRPERDDDGAAPRALAVLGRAGSGKTLVLAELARALREAGLKVVTGDWEGRKRDRRSVAILAPTNKAASVLRTRGVPATTIHRILYTPVYDPQYEALAEWLAGEGDRPGSGVLPDAALDRAAAFYAATPSVPGALAAAGLRGSDFITGWKRREESLDVGLVDEASMLDARGLADLREIFPTLILFGDPAQLAPVKGEGGEMAVRAMPAAQVATLTHVHRQEAGSPILDLAHALGTDIDFEGFEALVREVAARDERVEVAGRVDAGLMARSPCLVWTNKTRVRLIHAFRTAHDAPPDDLLPGEPLICDGIELPLKHRKRRLDLEARGLVRGAQVIYLGPGRKPGFSRLHVVGAEQPQVSAASIVKVEVPGEEEPVLPYAARMGAVFVHGAACTIHKAQGSQWERVQVFAPDLWVAARVGREEAGQPLWKRLAYVAVTRASERLRWVVNNRLAKPTAPLGTADLAAPDAPALEPVKED